MRNEILSNGEQYVKKNRFWRKWHHLMLALSSLVVFAITYAMILPAITLEQTEEEATAEQPLNVESYAESASLFYQLPGEDEWKKVEGEKIPGNASLKLQIDYKSVPIGELQSANGQMIYKLPDIFKDVRVNGTISSGNETVATMEVAEGAVILKFDNEWLTELLKKGETVLETGSFDVIAAVDLSQTKPEETLKIGNVEINVNFEKDLVAQYGTVDLEKTFVKLIETEDGNFFEYHLKVTAGADGCPEVKVVDYISDGAGYVKEYVEGSFFPSDNVTIETDEDNRQKLIWNIGDMAANTWKELTYQVKLADGYLGVTPKDPVVNTAEVYSKKYPRSSKTAAFQPQAGGTLSKKAAEYIKDSKNGGGTIQYTVWVKAPDTNNYTLKNVTIEDSLDGTVSGGNITEKKLLPYLSYEPGSFQLYEGGKEGQNGTEGLGEKIDGSAEIPLAGKSFQYNVGDLKPGECKTLIYTVRVSEGIFTAANDEKIKIQNRATIKTDPNVSDGGNHRLNSYNCDKDIDAKKWIRKLLGEKVEETKTIQMDNGSTFQIPAGSYQYQIVVNETGDWNVSSAAFKDTMNSQYMQYVGYLQIDAYKGIESTSSGTDQNVIENLKKNEPTATKWIDIDGKKSFETTPAAAGFSQEKQAYLLTYYAVPVNMSDMSSREEVTNQFQLEGNVGNHGTYQLSGIEVTVAVTVEGTNYFNAEKNFWYCDTDAEGKTALYWILKIKGNMIQKGTQLKDVIKKDVTKGEVHQIHSLEKAFITETLDDLSHYENIEALGQITDFKDYSETKGNEALTLTLTENLYLSDDQSLYFVVSTRPTKLPETLGSYVTYENELLTKDPIETAEWISQSESKYTLTSGGNIYKELGMVFTAAKNEAGQITESEITKIQGNQEEKGPKLQYDHLTTSGGGTYVAWKVTINKGSTLIGRYRIKEQIPQGMEAVYIQQYSSPDYGNRPWFVDQGDLEGYQKVTKVYQKDYDLNPITAYYYTKDQEVIWDVDGLQANPEKPGKFYVTFLVVCRLTDESVLLGGEEKEFCNQVSILNQKGKELGNSSDTVTLRADTLSKKGTYDPKINGGRYPFQITVNEDGTDLLKGYDTIQLVDKMCEYLILDPSTIQVVNTKTRESVGFSSQIDPEENTLILTLPDDQPLTITYEAAINAAPGQKIQISNQAYWYGYEKNNDSVKKDDFSYTVGGTVEVGTTPKVTITKRDQYKNQTTLQGAEFSLQEMKLENGTLAAAGTAALTGITDENGSLKFGEESSHLLKFNTVYRLTETKAPAGYVKNETSKDFLIAKLDQGKYPDEFLSYQQLNVTIYYSGAEYSIDVYNHKGEIQITKQFADAAGNLLSGKLSGTYRFGLYEVHSKTREETLVQTTEIKFQKETGGSETETAKFTNVELKKSYVVYELDDQGKPIKEGEDGMISGIPFAVSYSWGSERGNSVTVTAETPIAGVTVTNRMNYAELPASGGIGTAAYTVSGALLSLSAAGVLRLKMKRKRNK